MVFRGNRRGNFRRRRNQNNRRRPNTRRRSSYVARATKLLNNRYREHYTVMTGDSNFIYTASPQPGVFTGGLGFIVAHNTDNNVSPASGAPQTGSSDWSRGNFIQWNLANSQGGNPAVPVTSYMFIGYAPMLAQLSDAVSFSILYDRYQVLHAAITLEAYAINSVTYQEGTNITIPPLITVHSVLDYDDIGSPMNTTGGMESGSAVTVLQQYDTYKKKALALDGKSAIFRRYLPKPKVRQAVQGYISSTSSNVFGVSTTSPILDMANATIPHYGIKMLLEATNLDDVNVVTVFFKLQYKVWVKLMNVR